MKQISIRSAAAWLACLALSVTMTPMAAGAKEETVSASAAGTTPSAYQQYRADLDLPLASDRHELAAETAQTVEGGTPDNGALLIGDTGKLIWKVTVPKAALYSVGLKYASPQGSVNPIECVLRLNGALPFEGMQSIALGRHWKNDPNDMNGGAFKSDRAGNQNAPAQIPDTAMRTVWIEDTASTYPTPYLFALQQGENTIEVSFIRGGVRLKGLVLSTVDNLEAVTYEEYRRAHNGPDYKGDTLVVEGESASLKSSSAIVPENDRSSPAVSPSSPTLIKLNTIGGSCGTPGDWIEWTVNTAQAGWYSLGIKFRQNLVSGMFSTRVLTINGKVPFEEMRRLEFSYQNNWQGRVLADENGEAYRFYLEKGANTIRLQGASGRAAGLFERANASVEALNVAYRRIVMLTSTSPDPLRNYRIDATLPEVMETFRQQKAFLTAISQDILAIVGEKGSANTILDNLAQQLQSFIDKPITIPSRLEAFQQNIAALASWYYDMVWFPLSIDYLTLSAPEQGTPEEMQNVNASFFDKLAYEVLAFIGSFTTDYTSVAGEAEETGDPLVVWVNNSRFQSSLIKKMADAAFTPRTGIPVSIRITSIGTGVSPMLLATAAGTGPDAAMFMANGEAVNYASRGAAVDMTQFDTYDEVAARFMPGSLTPYAYQGGGYGLPDMANFQMMYVRRDILDDLGLEPPETWEELITVLGTLQKNNLTIGIPNDYNFLAARIYQAGGELFTEDGARSLLDSKEAMDVFKTWTNFYASYGIPVDFDPANRFRTGEMPIVINMLDFYTKMQYLAPELAGLWDFYPIPGTRREDGTIDRTGIIIGQCSMILATSKQPENAWKFLDLWTSVDVQAKNAQEYEMTMGSAYRYTTANVEAMKSLSWTKAELATILDVWETTRGIPEVPGGYYIGRSMDNALRNVLTYGNDAQEVLKEYVGDINREIQIKRREFGLE